MTFRKWYLGLAVSLGVGALAVVACGGGDDNSSPGDDAGNGGDSVNGNDTSAGDSAPPGDAGEDAAAAMTAACEAITNTACDKLSICDNGPALASCGVQARSCPGPIFGEGSNFTVDQANACAAALAAANCPELSPIVNGSGGELPPFAFLPACRVPGSRGGGESCEWSTQCASLYCASPESSYQTAFNGDVARCGSCAPMFGPNDDCSNNGSNAAPALGGPVCPPGTMCDTNTKRCTRAGAGDPCLTGFRCDYGTTCNLNPDGGAPICIANTPAGSFCDSNSTCADRGYCLFANASQADGGTCQPAVKAGGDCTTTAVASPNCTVDDYCVNPDGGGSDKRCLAGLEGQECNDVQCAPDLICDDRIVGQHVCRKRQKDGDPCGVVPVTYPDGGKTGSNTTLYCASTTCSTDCLFLRDGGPMGTCIGGTLLGGIGESCGDLYCTTCAPGSRCTNGKCVQVDVDCH